MVHRLQADVCFVVLLVKAVVSGSSSELPECRKAGSVFDLPDIDACKQVRRSLASACSPILKVS